ncbi:hypothetical protein JYU23_00920 [bacterium AH-315-C07]|nr:hypothetical protein [bacterium AH-315-C07]
MKRLIAILSIGLIFCSCEKEEFEPNENSYQCGEQNDGIVDSRKSNDSKSGGMFNDDIGGQDLENGGLLGEILSTDENEEDDVTGVTDENGGGTEVTDSDSDDDDADGEEDDVTDSDSSDEDADGEETNLVNGGGPNQRKYRR